MELSEGGGGIKEQLNKSNVEVFGGTIRLQICSKTSSCTRREGGGARISLGKILIQD